MDSVVSPFSLSFRFSFLKKLLIGFAFEEVQEVTSLSLCPSWPSGAAASGPPPERRPSSPAWSRGSTWSFAPCALPCDHHGADFVFGVQPAPYWSPHLFPSPRPALIPSGRAAFIVCLSKQCSMTGLSQRGPWPRSDTGESEGTKRKIFSLLSPLPPPPLLKLSPSQPRFHYTPTPPGYPSTLRAR